MSTPAQLRIAARIHYALKGMLGEGIDVSAMLNDPAEAREVIYVCQASGNPELVALANQFLADSDGVGLADASARAKAEAGPAKTQPAPLNFAWDSDNSGFGMTQPSELSTQPNARTRWLKNFAQRLTR